MICICFLPIYQSLVQPDPDGYDSVLVQIKSNEMERDGASRPVGREDGVFGDDRRRKEVLLPQQKVTSLVIDGP